MADLCIQLNKIQNEPQNIKDYMKIMQNQMSSLSSVKGNINLGSSTGSVKKSIENVSDELNNQYTAMKLFAEQLEAIIREYQQTEQKLTGASPNTNEVSDAGGKEDAENSYLENAIKQALMGEFYDGETNPLGDVLSLIISFVPGLNCIADIRDLAADLMLVLEDGKLNLKEAGLIAVDVITVVGDVVSFGQLVKGVKGATKATKVAKTAQKTAAKEAKQAAKVAKKEAKDLAKKAGDAAKEAAEKGTRKTTRKATQIAKNAEKAAENAKDAENAANTAKNAAKEASKAHNKNIAKETVKQVAQDEASKSAQDRVNDQIKDEYKSQTREDLKQSKK